MTADTLTHPTAPPQPANGDDEPDHLYCCDPDIAMCGVDVSDATEVGPDIDGPLCKLCAYVCDEGLPCPAGCPGGGQ
jgi:hypothetical protein